jgi:O-antigen ligase
MWETGIMGTILFFLFPFFIFLDSARLCKEEGLPGAYPLGMLSFSTFFALSAFYTFTIDSNVLIFMFFLASGQLVSQYSQADDRQFETRPENFA